MVFKNAGNSINAADFNREVEYVYVYTAFECVSTGVEETRAALLTDNVLVSATLSATNNVVIDGVDYLVDGTYDNALWTNLNFNRMARFIRENSTIMAHASFRVPGDAATQLDAVRISGGTDTAGEFGTNMIDVDDGFWLNVFVVESTETLETASDAPNGVAAITAVTNIETDMAVVNAYFNTTLADGNNEDSMGGALSVGDAVSGEITAGDRNLIVRVSDTPLG